MCAFTTYLFLYFDDLYQVIIEQVHYIQKNIQKNLKKGDKMYNWILRSHEFIINCKIKIIVQKLIADYSVIFALFNLTEITAIEEFF